MSEVHIPREELFGPSYTFNFPQNKPKKLKETIGTSKTETVNQLSAVQSVTVFGDVFLATSRTAQEHGINIYAYRRDREERYKHRYYWGIFAVRAGNPKTRHPKELTDVIAAIEDFPQQVNYRRSSRQYTLLRAFQDALETLRP